MDVRTVMKSKGKELKAWIQAIQDELSSIEVKEVKTDLTEQEIYDKYLDHGKKPIRLPAKLVLTEKPLHDGKGGFKKKARICVCGNFEAGVGHDPYNRSEVPSTYELRTLLALAEGLEWDVGALDIRVAFLNAALNDDVDPIYLVNPPELLRRLGLIPMKKWWKLGKVLYGLRSGPKKWGMNVTENCGKR